MRNRTHIIILLLIFILIAFLTACATPYKPEGFSGGYSDLSLNKNTYRVSFRGNGFTSLDRVQQYLLYRSAQIAQQNGYRYFIILASNIDDKKSHFSLPTTASSTDFSLGHGGFNSHTNYDGQNANTYGEMHYANIGSHYTTINPGHTFNIHKYRQSIVIRLIHLQKHLDGAIDASRVINEIKV